MSVKSIKQRMIVFILVVCMLMLDSLFEDEGSLKGYSVNPLHVDIADNKVRPFVAQRSCLDFEIPN